MSSQKKGEEEKIEGGKDADDPRQGRQEDEMKKADLTVDLRPGRDHGRHPQKRCEKNEKQADPVHGQVKTDPEGRKPRHAHLGKP